MIIRNADSGKLMGVKGRRVALVEQLSGSVISFQKVLIQLRKYPEKRSSGYWSEIQESHSHNHCDWRGISEESSGTHWGYYQKECFSRYGWEDSTSREFFLQRTYPLNILLLGWNVLPWGHSLPLLHLLSSSQSLSHCHYRPRDSQNMNRIPPIISDLSYSQILSYWFSRPVPHIPEILRQKEFISSTPRYSHSHKRKITRLAETLHRQSAERRREENTERKYEEWGDTHRDTTTYMAMY